MYPSIYVRTGDYRKEEYVCLGRGPKKLKAFARSFKYQHSLGPFS